MKKYFTLLGFVFLLNSSLAIAEETLVRDPVVNINKTLSFGIWKIYNDGDTIFVVDKEDMHFVQLDSSAYFSTADPDSGLWVRNDGTANSWSVDKEGAAKALEIVSSGNLEDGRYGFGDRRFVVNGDTLTIFEIDYEDTSGNVSIAQVLKKNSNEMVHNGTSTSTIIEATKTLDAGAVVTPTGMPSDCLASYLPATGEVIIPCLSVEGSNTVYRVKQHQIPGTMTFEVGDGDVSRVQ